ncbi:sarcosine oxidase subunit gamma [Hoyosella sp. YIM 151337]|uniref:sarcosine oxidase subunit gamma n=1 Tax=Hoyosella sp. YIM 151337 TaxID=2992742 RepID=UPI002236BC17|nr:sarcosine oxidase subunit gamma family protein [Hoyosella sp. YIM 151337]MCW4355724.1 sarcosine oxidase subunit gamma [Hoyosella sp. YIM 151337]
MARVLTPASPLEAWEERFSALAPAVSITEEPFTTMTTLWVDPSGPGGRAASGTLGVELPTTPSTCVTHGGTTVVWMGPEEWLVTSASPAPALENDLRSAVAPHGGSATDVSGQRTVVHLKGSRARDILEKGCSIDLHPRAFTRGSAVQTMLDQAGVVLIALDDAGTDYRILVRSSFAHYLASWLLDAAAEFTLGSQ